MSTADSSATPRGVGRCFVCLCDQDPTSNEAWVHPCPCSLEGHQDCMMTWITELENERKPIKCPVCKADIHVDEPFDPAVTLGNSLHKTFSRASPWILAGGVISGTNAALAVYGQMAMGTFAGWEELHRFLAGPPGVVKLRRLGILQLVAPSLLIAQTLPPLGNYVFLPVAGLYGMFQAGRNDDFFSWPPSPQLVMTTLPIARFFYRQLWWEFLRPYERKFDRRIAGLPDPDPNEERRNGRRNGDGGLPNQNQNNDDHEHRHEHGGIVGLLDAAINLLDVADVDVDFQVQEQLVAGADPNADGGDMHRLEIEIEAFGGDEDEDVGNEGFGGPGGHRRDVAFAQGLGAEEIEERAIAGAGTLNERQEGEGEGEGDDARPPQHQPHQQPLQQQPQQPQQQNDDIAADAGAADAGAAAGNRQLNLQATLRDFSNAIAAALLLPAISATAGEALNVLLPKSMTAPADSSVTRPGLLRQTWGRSFVGGCLYFVIRDAFRFYTKYKRAKNKPLRKVREVDPKEKAARSRGEASG